MPSLNFVTLDVFTQTRFAGNPLAVVKISQNHEISTEQMQSIAREFNLSETLFIHERPSGSSDEIPKWRVRIFFPTSELPFAGHPTIGAACYALSTLAPGAEKGRLICNAGRIELEYAAGVAKAAIPHNFHKHTEVQFTLDQVYQLQPALKKSGHSLEKKAISVLSPVKGMNFVCVELPDLEMLALISTSAVRPEPVLDKEWRHGFAGSYYYVRTQEKDGVVKLQTRMIVGELEDPATGSAACGLCMYLSISLDSAKVMNYEITQGLEMGRKSDIGVSVTTKLDSQGSLVVENIELSGSAVKVMEGAVEY